MPCQVTHMYLAGRLAQDYTSSHKSDVIKDINTGFAAWLQANKDFRQGAEAAIGADSRTRMQACMDAYRNTVQSRDDIAVFSAFAAGTMGPDIWMVPHEGTIRMAINRGITGQMHFDLGHYNLSHRFPQVVLRRLRAQAKALPELQRKYQTAFVLGYLSHIALDITGHIKVNVFAGAYFQMEKDWENEQGMLVFDIFNNHNKIEQYFDQLLRFVCFEGYHDRLKSFNNLRTGVLGQSDLWDFPNYTDYWGNRLSFGIFGTDGIWNADVTFLDLSTSLSGPFARRYEEGPAQSRVTPWVHRDFCQAYSLLDEAHKRHWSSIHQIDSELPKIRYFRMDNDSNVTSQYYYLQTVIPNMDKICDWGTKFYNPDAFGQFVLAGRKVATEFIDGALKYLDSGDEAIFDLIRTWNLDIGMAIRFKDTSGVSDPNNPKKPNRPVTIDLVSVAEAVPSLSDWQPPTLDIAKWRDKQELITWKQPSKTRLTPAGGSSTTGGSGDTTSAAAFSQSGLDIRLVQFKLYADSDELAAYLFGLDGADRTTTNVPDDHTGYKISGCVEDFAADDEFSQTKDSTSGKFKLKEYLATFLSRIPPPTPSQPGGTAAPTPLTRFPNHHCARIVRVSACRKYVCKTHDTSRGADSGNFHSRKFQIYQNAYPSEEMVLAIFALIRHSTSYVDLFHHCTFTPEDIVRLKRIREKGVNVILLIFSQKEEKKKKTLTIEEAWVDGERQPIDKATIPSPAVYKVEFEDLLFRTDSAVVLPEAYTDRDESDASQDRISGLDVLQVIYVQAKEYPNQKLIITGHTDRVARDSYNIPLSRDRADSVLHLLEGKKDDWKKLADRRNRRADKQHILEWVAREYGWDCDPGGITDKNNTKTVKATRAFQKRYNREFIDTGRVSAAYGTSASKIGEDGDFGPQTWGAVFDIYQDSLAKRLVTTFEKMGAFHTSLNGRWVEDTNKAVPCGETFPKCCPELDEYECSINRRVEALFFDPAEVPSTPLPCNSTEQISSQSAVAARKKNCTDKCPVYKGKEPPQPLSVTPHSRPQASPALQTPQHPGSSSKLPVDGVFAYLAYYKKGTADLAKVRCLKVKQGKFCDRTGKEVTVDCDRDTWLYFSHRDGLDLTDKAARFAQAGTGLPLQGPVKFSCGENVQADVDIWAQKDWAIVQGKALDGRRPSEVRMGEWKTNYSIGTYKYGTAAFDMHGDYKEKQKQEKWMGGDPVLLVNFGSRDGDPLWIGTLSVPPTPKVKLLLVHKTGSGGTVVVYAGSFNEIAPKGDNQEFTHHRYDSALVGSLLGISQSDQSTSSVDALQNPPASFLLPGDICWHDQNGHNACGPFSIAAAMNYWWPYTNNPQEHNGMWYHDTDRVPSVGNGARTPSNLVDGAKKYGLSARDNDAEDIDRARALKLLKLWISAGVPVAFLVKEYHKISSYHWKVAVGYENNRLFLVNSGADDEYDTSKWDAGVTYDTAPVGNDVDSWDDHYTKWHEAGGDIADFFTSVDRCTFIPLYPGDASFGGSTVI